MALSPVFRQSVKNRKRRSRRFEVVMFFVWMALALWNAGRPWTLQHLGNMTAPYIFVIGRILSLWGEQRKLKVSSLDDWAMFEDGVKFDELGEKRQEELLRSYRVGIRVVDGNADEREMVAEQESYQQAYRLMRWVLPGLAVVHWVGWKLLPEGRFRAGWTDGPVVLTWVLLFVLALPQMVRMWTEPDEVGEAKLVVERERSAQSL